MTISSKNATLEIARSIMDQALSAPQAIEIRFYDDQEGGEANGKRTAQRWATRIFQARASMRRLQIRMASPQDLISSGLTSNAVDPEAVRTVYDTLYTETRRETAERPCWVLRIAQADMAGLNLTVL